MDDRFNTIAGWVLFAGIIALGSSISRAKPCTASGPRNGLSDCRRRGRHGRRCTAEKPIEAYLASADATKGGDVFKKCGACHNADKGGANQMGPNLWGVIGEPVGQGKGFAFSDALAKKGGKWDWASLRPVAEEPEGRSLPAQR